MPRSLSRRLFQVTPPIRKRWSADDAGAVLDRLDSSGLSVGEFADRENLSPQRLYRWRTQLGDQRSKNPAFVEIRPPVRAGIEVVLGSGRVLRVPTGFCEHTLRRLVAVLDERGPQC